MNPKIKIGLAAAVLLAAVLAIYGWPAGKSAEASPSTAPAPKLSAASSGDPTTKLPATPPAKPMSVALQVAPPAAPAVVAGGTSTGDPQAEIATAVDDIIGLLRSSEILAFYEKYTSPEDKAKWPPGLRAEYAREDAMVKANPSGGGKMESMIGGFESMKGQTPQMNAAGDEATFQFTMQPPPGFDGSRVTPMIMAKIDGKWYLKTW